MLAAWILLALIAVLVISNAWAGDVEETDEMNAERVRNGDEPFTHGWWVRPAVLIGAFAFGVGEMWFWSLAY